VVCCYWSIPIRHVLLILAVGCRSSGQKRKGEGGGLTGEASSGEDVQKVDGELAPVVGNGEEVADDVRTMMTNPNV
jgi:hypothetical protein